MTQPKNSPSEDTAAELQRIREQRAEVGRKRHEARSVRENKQLLERERRALDDETAIAELEAAAGELKVIETDIGLIAVKAPVGLEFQRFVDAKQTSYQLISQFVSPCVVYPSQARFAQVLEQKPAILNLVSAAVMALAGVRESALASKSG